MQTNPLDHLNDAQRQAATYGHIDPSGAVSCGPLLIIAGAGTGKTTTLAHRVGWLLAQGVAPERLLLMTFSRRAAREMTERAQRVAERFGPARRPGRLAWAGTFHSIAHRILRRHAAQLELDPGFSIIDTSDAADIMDVLRHEMGLAERGKRFPHKGTCQAIYSRCINTRQTLDQVLPRHFPWCESWEEELRDLFQAFVQRKQGQALLDYDDLLLYLMWLLEEPELAHAIGSRFDHILVDEYQDTNVLQARILECLRPQGEGVCVVGDDAQSIYSFRAAEVDNILRFPEQFSPPAELIALECNYRSSQPILDAANALLGESLVGYKKDLRSDRGAGPKPRLITVEADQDQAQYVVEKVLAAREAGTALRRQSILFRAGHHSDRLEVELVQRDIPYVKYGGLKFLEAAHVKDALSVLRWASNPRNGIAAFRVLKLLPGVGPARASATLDHLSDHQHAFSALAKGPLGTDSRLVALAEVLLASEDGESRWQGQMERCIDWYHPLLELHYPDHHVRAGDLDQLLEISHQYPTRDHFLADLTLDPPSSSSDLAGPPHLDDDFLILSTIHSAKGQEWDNVFVLNVNDGNFPNEFACGDDKAIEEERRLLYVAMTRAKAELHLITPLKYWVPEQRKFGDRHVYGAKSRFLTDTVCEHFEQIGFGKMPGGVSAPNLPADIRINIGAKARSMFG